MSGTGAAPEYRIEDLAHASGATVRTIRGYQDRGLLPTPERRGRANVYGDTHLTRLRQIAGLLDRGYTLASIKELLDAWDTGRGLGNVLGLAAEVNDAWTDETAGRVSRADLDTRFGGTPNEPTRVMCTFVNRRLDHHLGARNSPPESEETRPVPIPAATMLAVQRLVGAENVPAFVAAATEREVQARALDTMASTHGKTDSLDQ